MGIKVVKKHIYNISGTAKCIKLKFSGNFVFLGGRCSTKSKYIVYINPVQREYLQYFKNR